MKLFGPILLFLSLAGLSAACTGEGDARRKGNLHSEEGRALVARWGPARTRKVEHLVRTASAGHELLSQISDPVVRERAQAQWDAEVRAASASVSGGDERVSDVLKAEGAIQGKRTVREEK